MMCLKMFKNSRSFCILCSWRCVCFSRSSNTLPSDRAVISLAFSIFPSKSCMRSILRTIKNANYKIQQCIHVTSIRRFVFLFLEGFFVIFDLGWVRCSPLLVGFWFDTLDEVSFIFSTSTGSISSKCIGIGTQSSACSATCVWFPSETISCSFCFKMYCFTSIESHKRLSSLYGLWPKWIQELDEWID